MKKEIDQINATPTKNIYKSIIADYDVHLAICELVDNVLDQWILGDKEKEIYIKIDFDTGRNTITFEDNAGGISKEDMVYLISPGQSKNSDDKNTIGLFGVGSKRAVVAVASEIRIKSRAKDGKTMMLEYNDAWLESESWTLPLFEDTEINESTTIIELNKLRMSLTEEDEMELYEKLAQVYGRLLGDKFSIVLNDIKVEGESIENWSYHPEYKPINFSGEQVIDHKDVRFDITVGLYRKSSPSGDYGISFYCNDRLVVKNLNSFEAGYITGQIGKPHPSRSLANATISINGPASCMPWNSSKSEIDTKHQLFGKLREIFLPALTEYSTLSKRLEGEWAILTDYETGTPKNVVMGPATRIKTYTPELPKARVDAFDKVKNANKELEKSKPWTRGSHEAIAAVEKIKKFKIETSTRLAYIVLDSTLEIAFKDYLVNDSGTVYSEDRIKKICSNRSEVHKEIEKHLPGIIDFNRVTYFYNMRCKLVHERATTGISKADLEDFEELVKEIFAELFGSIFN